jgi:spermidine/putrescine transport system permease protein
MTKDAWKPWALLAPAITSVFLLLVIPVCFIVVYSFWLRSPTGADIAAFQMGNYAKFFEDMFYPAIMLRTIRVSLETVLLCLVMGYIPAYFFYRSTTRFKSMLLLLIMLPFWISFIIRTMSWIDKHLGRYRSDQSLSDQIRPFVATRKYAL